MYFGDAYEWSPNVPALRERPLPRHPPSRLERKLPVIESTLIQHDGKVEHLSNRISAFEKTIERLTQLSERQTATIEGLQQQLQQQESQIQDQSLLQIQYSSLEDAVLDLMSRIEAEFETKQQELQLPGANIPLSPPLTPIIPSQQLSESVPVFELRGDDDNINLNASVASILVTPPKTPRSIVSFEPENEMDTLSPASSLTLIADDIPVGSGEVESESYDQRLCRQFVNRLRRALGSPPPTAAPEPDGVVNFDNLGDLCSAALPSPILSPNAYRVDVGTDLDTDIFSSSVCAIEGNDTAATAATILEEAAGLIDMTPLRTEKPMSRAELRFKGSAQIKDLYFELQRRLKESGCEELWNGGESAVVSWGGAGKVDERTKKLAIKKLGWMREVEKDER